MDDIEPPEHKGPRSPGPGPEPWAGARAVFLGRGQPRNPISSVTPGRLTSRPALWSSTKPKWVQDTWKLDRVGFVSRLLVDRGIGFVSHSGRTDGEIVTSSLLMMLSAAPSNITEGDLVAFEARQGRIKAVVILDLQRQIQSYVMSQQYASILKNANISGSKKSRRR